jgi:hypothetical protein
MSKKYSKAEKKSGLDDPFTCAVMVDTMIAHPQSVVQRRCRSGEAPPQPLFAVCLSSWMPRNAPISTFARITPFETSAILLIGCTYTPQTQNPGICNLDKSFRQATLEFRWQLTSTIYMRDRGPAVLPCSGQRGRSASGFCNIWTPATLTRVGCSNLDDWGSCSNWRDPRRNASLESEIWTMSDPEMASSDHVG